MKEDLRSVRLWGFTLVIGAFCVIMGPFGTFSKLTFLQRLPYWMVLVLAYMLIGLVVRLVSERRLPTLPRAARTALEAVLVALLVTPVTILWSRVIGGSGYEMRLGPLELFVVSVATYVLVDLTLQLPDDEHMLRRAQPLPRLARRLEGASAAPIVHLTVDDHYVEITQSDGTRHRLLMRFSDAVDEMDGVDGFCVHRSHWVRKSAIREAWREKGRDLLRLSTGQVVPVSKTYRPNLVAAGILAEAD